jgi:hypothetical protein
MKTLFLLAFAFLSLVALVRADHGFLLTQEQIAKLPEASLPLHQLVSKADELAKGGNWLQAYYLYSLAVRKLDDWRMNQRGHRIFKDKAYHYVYYRKGQAAQKLARQFERGRVIEPNTL